MMCDDGCDDRRGRG